MKQLFVAAFFLLITAVSFAQNRVGAAGVCHTDENPNFMASMEDQDVRSECLVVVDTLHGYIYFYIATLTPGSQWWQLPLEDTNDAYNLSFTRSNDTLFIQDGDGTLNVKLPADLDGQTLSWDGGTGVLSISGGNTVDLDGRYLQSFTEVDGSVTNELQQVDTFRIAANQLEVSLSNDGVGVSSVDLSPYISRTDEEIQDVVGGMVTGNTETLITVTYQDGDGTLDFEVTPTLSSYTNDVGFLTSEVDGDPTNELQQIDTARLSTYDLELSLSDDGVPLVTVDLEPLRAGLALQTSLEDSMQVIRDSLEEIRLDIPWLTPGRLMSTSTSGGYQAERWYINNSFNPATSGYQTTLGFTTGYGQAFLMSRQIDPYNSGNDYTRIGSTTGRMELSGIEVFLGTSTAFRSTGTTGYRFMLNNSPGIFLRNTLPSTLPGFNNSSTQNSGLQVTTYGTTNGDPFLFFYSGPDINQDSIRHAWEFTTNKRMRDAGTFFRMSNQARSYTYLDVLNNGRTRIGGTANAAAVYPISFAWSVVAEDTLRIGDLSPVPTRIIGADADGDVGQITLGSGLSLSGGTLTNTATNNIYTTNGLLDDPVRTVYMPTNGVFEVRDSNYTSLFTLSGAAGPTIDLYVVDEDDNAIAGYQVLAQTASMYSGISGVSGAVVQASHLDSAVYVYNDDSNVKLGVNQQTATETLDVNGQARIRDLVAGTPTAIVGATSTGVLSNITIGSGLSLTSGTLSTTGGGGGGEINIGANIGAGEGVYESKSDTTLRFKTLLAGFGLNISSDSDEITYSVDSSEVATQFDISGFVDKNIYTADDTVTGFRQVFVPSGGVLTLGSQGTVGLYSEGNAYLYSQLGSEFGWIEAQPGYAFMTAQDATNVTGINLFPAYMEMWDKVHIGLNGGLGPPAAMLEVDADVIIGDLTTSSAKTRIVGATATGLLAELKLGTNLTISNDTLNAAGGAGSTNLSFTGASSPVTLNSSTGDDVIFAAGGNVTLSQSADTLTITALSDEDWDFVVGDTYSNPVTRSGKVSIGVSDTTRQLRVDGDWKFIPNISYELSFESVDSSTNTPFRGVGLFDNSVFTSSSSIGGSGANFIVGALDSLEDRFRLGTFAFTGKTPGGSGQELAAFIEANATGSWTGSNQGTALDFYATQNGETFTRNVLTVQGNGRLVLQRYSTFSSDGLPIAFAGINSSRELTRHVIGGTSGAGKVIAVNGANNGLEYLTLPAGGGGVEITSTTLETTSITGVVGKITLVDCSAAARTVAPPASPAINDRFAVSDATANSATNNITIDFVTATQNLLGASQNYILNVDGGYIEFIYVDSTTGWIATKG